MMTRIKKELLNNLNLQPGVETFLLYSAKNSSLLPAWWSEVRENQLNVASIENDMLSSIIQTMIMKIFTLPLKVIPKNQYINAATILADNYNTILYSGRQLY